MLIERSWKQYAKDCFGCKHKWFVLLFELVIVCITLGLVSNINIHVPSGSR